MLRELHFDMRFSAGLEKSGAKAHLFGGMRRQHTYDSGRILTAVNKYPVAEFYGRRLNSTAPLA